MGMAQYAGVLKEESKLVGKTLNSKWRAKGLENPILYSEEDELLEI